MSGNLDLDTLRKMIESKEIDTVVVAFPDLQGRLIGKRVTGHFFLSHGVEELHACDYLLALDMDMEPVPGYKKTSWDKGYGDFGMRVDLSTLRLIPWLPGTALVLSDIIDHDGNLEEHAPRSMLKKQVRRANEMGFTLNMASELELYVFDESFESAVEKDYKNLKTAGWYIEDYHILQTTKEEPLIRAIRNHMDNAGVPVEFSKGEWGPGQEEINLRYTDALEMADRHVIYKNGAKEIAHLQGKAITFMAKWNSEMAGNSCHVHTSLWDTKTGKSAFYDPSGPDEMSATFRHFLAGQLAAANEMTYFLAPYINSYKRFQSGSFAPTKAVWARDNRTAGFRTVGSGQSYRVECRIPGGDANPYLAFSALIAAGLHGIENKMELEPELKGNAYEDPNARDVPHTLRDALVELENSKILRAAFGDDVLEHYLHTGRWEQKEFDRKVTDWEVRRYFERG